MRALHIRLMLRKIDKTKYNILPTFEELAELERLAQIGFETELKFDEGYILTQSIGRHSEMHDINSIEELLKG